MEYLEFRFAFHARDFIASVNFYHKTLGMKYLGGWDRPDGKGALLQSSGGAAVEIYGAAEGSHYDGPPPRSLNLALRVADRESLDASYQELESRGAKTSGPPQSRPWGHRSFIVFDPDGIPVHLYCETPEE